MAICGLPFALAVVLFVTSWNDNVKPQLRSGGVQTESAGEEADLAARANHRSVSDAATDWIDGQSPTTFEIEQAATELAQQTESFYPRTNEVSQ